MFTSEIDWKAVCGLWEVDLYRELSFIAASQYKIKATTKRKSSVQCSADTRRHLPHFFNGLLVEVFISREMNILTRSTKRTGRRNRETFVGLVVKCQLQIRALKKWQNLGKSPKPVTPPPPGTFKTPNITLVPEVEFVHAATVMVIRSFDCQNIKWQNRNVFRNLQKYLFESIPCFWGLLHMFNIVGMFFSRLNFSKLPNYIICVLTLGYLYWLSRSDREV